MQGENKLVTTVTLITTAEIQNARGSYLAKTGQVFVDINPRVYDLHITPTSGGVIDGYIEPNETSWWTGTAYPTQRLTIKKPIDLYQLIVDKYGAVKIRNDDIVNLTIDPYVGIYGKTNPRANLFRADSLKNIGVDLGVPADGIWNDQILRYTIGNDITDGNCLFGFQLKHSAGQHTAVDQIFDIDFQKCYGKMRFFCWSLHAASCTLRWVIYNADGSIALDTVRINAGGEARTDTMDYVVQKGQYAKLHLNYAPGSVSSKNNTFLLVRAATMGGEVSPAILISGAHFNETNEVNIYNNGAIIGYGGDADNNAGQRNYNDLWNQEFIPVYPDTHPRKYTGGDAIASTNLKRLRIVNGGTARISGGGGASSVKFVKSGDNYYYPGGGGAPKGRGGTSYERFSGGSGYLGNAVKAGDAPYGSVGGVGWNGGVNGGNIGEQGIDTNVNTGYLGFAAGKAVRGSTATLEIA